MVKTPFLEAAERCDQLGRTIKEKQFSAAGVDAFPVDEARQEPPLTAWARRFATHVLRPVRSEAARPPLLQFMAPPAGMPKIPDLPPAEAPQAPGRAAGDGYIGAALGKNGPRRRWLGRLFRRSGN